MFTVGAFFVIAAMAFLGARSNEQDRRLYDANASDEQRRDEILLHSRQDLKLIAFLLAAILVALGIIADRLH